MTKLSSTTLRSGPPTNRLRSMQLTVGGGATGSTPTVRSLPGKLSILDAATNTASHCGRLRPSTRRATGQDRKIAARVHRLKVGQHLDVAGIGIDERSRNRFRSGLYAAARLGGQMLGEFFFQNLLDQRFQLPLQNCSELRPDLLLQGTRLLPSRLRGRESTSRP
jgi:hypothetical protein